MTVPSSRVVMVPSPSAESQVRYYTKSKVCDGRRTLVKQGEGLLEFCNRSIDEWVATCTEWLS
jgi:hypothetical protein